MFITHEYHLKDESAIHTILSLVESITPPHPSELPSLDAHRLTTAYLFPTQE